MMPRDLGGKFWGIAGRATSKILIPTFCAHANGLSSPQRYPNSVKGQRVVQGSHASWKVLDFFL